MENHAKSAHHEGGSKAYVMLAINLGLSLLVMYLAMFAMIWCWGEFIQNVKEGRPEAQGLDSPLTVY